MKPAQIGFTLLELLVSTTLAMFIAASVATAFFQTRAIITRVETQLHLAEEARVIYQTLETSFASMQQSCAMVTLSTASDGSGATDPGTVALIFMRGNEDPHNFGAADYNSSHLVWELWEWRRATGTIHAGVNRTPQEGARSFKIGSTFRPNGATDYNGKSFTVVPQPRRWLDPVNPTGGPVLSGPPVSRLDDNIWFPAPSDTKVSLVGSEDLGDYSDLRRSTAGPSFDRVTDLAFEIVPHDETLAPVRVADTATTTTVFQGVWVDGRLGTGANRQLATLDPPQNFIGSDASKRPKLVRLRLTLTDPATKVTQTFSFSFSLPGLAPAN